MALRGSSRRDDRFDFLRGLALLVIFIDHVPKNFFEAFLFPVTDGGPTEAYTAAPVAGPFLPWTGTTTLPLPAIPEKQLAFTVMYQTLAYERAPRPAADPPGKRAGQQWWIDDKTGKAVLYGPFPIPNQ